MTLYGVGGTGKYTLVEFNGLALQILLNVFKAAPERALAKEVVQNAWLGQTFKSIEHVDCLLATVFAHEARRSTSARSDFSNIPFDLTCRSQCTDELAGVCRTLEKSPLCLNPHDLLQKRVPITGCILRQDHAMLAHHILTKFARTDLPRMAAITSKSRTFTRGIKLRRTIQLPRHGGQPLSPLQRSQPSEEPIIGSLHREGNRHSGEGLGFLVADERVIRNIRGDDRGSRNDRALSNR